MRAKAPHEKKHTHEKFPRVCKFCREKILVKPRRKLVPLYGFHGCHKDHMLGDDIKVLAFYLR